MNLLEQQAANRRRTWLVMAVFVALFAVLGAGFDVLVIGGGGATFIPLGTVAAIALGGGQALWGLRRGDRAVLASSAAQPLEDLLNRSGGGEDPLRYQQFRNIVDEMAIASGLPAPAAYVIPDPDPNAFATGRDPAHASIAVTEGLLRSLNREELQGVIAHEMAHIRNYDIRLMTVVAALVGAIALLADWSARIMRGGGTRLGGSRGKKGGANAVFLVIWLVAIMLAPLVGRLLALAVSRRREFLADATAAELTRNPLGLARALEKIHASVDPTHAIKRGTAHLCIDDPLGRKIDDRRGMWANLWATHPPMALRIEALRTMGYEPPG